jgi:hypothetical protein
MVLSIRDLKKEIRDVVRQNIENEYNELLKLNDFPKDHMWINQFWFKYVKNVQAQITQRGKGFEKMVAPIYKFIPDPTNRIKFENLRFPSAIFDTKAIEPSLIDFDPASKTRVRKLLQELILTCLESSRQEIPSMEEVKDNLNVNIEGFLTAVEQNEKVRSIAPISGLEWTDTITDEGVRLSEPILLDLQNVEMIKYNKRDPSYFDYFYDFKSPVVVVEFAFDWIPNPHDYSVAQNIERLHQTAKHKFDTILNACRLLVQHPDRV